MDGLIGNSRRELRGRINSEKRFIMSGRVISETWAGLEKSAKEWKKEGARELRREEALQESSEENHKMRVYLCLFLVARRGPKV